MHKKSLVIGILILLLSVNIGSTFAGDVDVKTMSSVSFDGNTLYVGGSGPNNYTTIQEAINDAVDGDIVFVYNGTYFESIVINKEIELIGENKYTSIIDGEFGSDVIFVSSSNVSIFGFTIKNGLTSGINVNYDNCKIMGNIINISQNGVIIFCSKYCIISENIITENRVGILISEWWGPNLPSFNQVKNNDIINNEYGIDVSSSSTSISNNNIIENNQQAKFFGFNNKWKGNFWGNSTSSPKLIFGILGIFRIPPIGIPWFNFDWNPAQEPYDIGG